MQDEPKLQIQWSARSLEEREQIIRHIAEDSVETAIRIDERIEAEDSVLGRFPFLGRKSRIGEFRLLPVRSTDYVIVYRLREMTIEIVRVLHGARRVSQRL